MMSRHRTILTTAIALLVPAIGAADTPDPGCYQRHYSDNHLADNPAQVVAKIRMLIYEDDQFGETLATIEVQMAQQGHALESGLGGNVLAQSLFCGATGNPTICAVDCDGGSLEITRQNKTELRFRTDYLTIGNAEGCGGVSDLAEVAGEFVSYRLEAAPMSTCGDLR